jgi:curved DNA-binding protein
VIDPYAVLGLTSEASEEDVKNAYRKLAMKYHPDKNPGDKASEEKFKEINVANDAIKSGKYDEQPTFSGFGRTGFSNLDDIIAAFNAKQRQKNRDIEVLCKIDLDRAFNGGEANFTIKDGDGNIKDVKFNIPAGVDTNSIIRIPQAGDRTFASLIPGDLFVRIFVDKNPTFDRHGPHLIRTIEMNILDFLVTDEIVVQAIDGQDVKVSIPEGFNLNSQVRISGHGMPILNSNRRGDLFISISLLTQKLNEEAKEKIRIVSKTIDG